MEAWSDLALREMNIWGKWIFGKMSIWGKCTFGGIGIRGKWALVQIGTKANGHLRKRGRPKCLVSIFSKCLQMSTGANGHLIGANGHLGKRGTQSALCPFFPNVCKWALGLWRLNARWTLLDVVQSISQTKSGCFSTCSINSAIFYLFPILSHVLLFCLSSPPPSWNKQVFP